VDRAQLRERQGPLKERYREDPGAALITLRASGTLGDGVSCSVATGRAIAEAGLHPATGGDGTQLCSGDMLLEALAACAGGMDLDLLARWLDHLGFTAAERDLVSAASRWVTGAPLRAATTPAQIARAARGAPVEAVALAGGDNAVRWIDELRHVRLEINGDDLLAAGVPEGPEVGRRLQAALDRRLDGEIAGREAELAAALGADVEDSVT